MGAHYSHRPLGHVKYLLGGHFDDLRQPTKFNDCYVPDQDLNPKHLLEYGDVIFAGKGHRNLAWAYQDSFGKAVASTLFYVLKVDQTKILPEYLAFYLNSKRVQHKLLNLGTGGTIPTIRSKELGSLTVRYPDIDHQRYILGIASTLDQDIALANELLDLKLKMRNAIIHNLIDKKDK